MARQAVVDAVEEYLSDNWADSPATPIISENTDETTPESGSDYIVIQYPYCNSRQISVGAPGNNVWRDEGAFRLVVHTERGKGTRPGRQICDSLADLFRGKDLTVLQTYAPSAPVTDDRNDKATYWVMSISVPYIHDYFA